MSDANIAVLTDRGVVSVTGEDAGKLLGGLLTNDIEQLATQPAMFAGLLSPQGKILFDFIVVRDGNAFLLDVAREKAADLAKRLIMYRLRARVQIEDTSSTHHVLAAWPGNMPLDGDTEKHQRITFTDPRHPALGWRALIGSVADQWLAAKTENDGTEAAYRAHRIALGVPEGGKDYDYGDTFVHEADFDLIGGVSFTKGCYVGQEIVARMEHRGTVRKRVVRVTGDGMLPADRPDVMMGDVVIGRLGSVAGTIGLALIRLDRAIEAIDKGVPITAGGVAVTIDPTMIDRQRRLMVEKATNP